MISVVGDSNEQASTAPAADAGASVTHFRLLADALPQIVWTAAPDGSVDFANAAFYAYVGADAVNLPAGEWVAAVHPDDLPGAVAAWERAHATGGPYAAEFRLKRVDGAYRWHDVSAVALRDAHGQIVKWTGSALDVHDRREAARQLAESEARFRAIAAATTDVVWDWDLRTNDVWWNDGLSSVLGYQPDALPGDGLARLRIVHVGDRSRVLAGLQDAIARADRDWADEYRCLHQDGRVLYVEDRGRVIVDENGTPVRFVGGLSDVTERRHTQHVLEEQGRLLDEATDAIMVRGIDGQISYWNRSAERLFGWRADEAIGAAADALLYSDPAQYRAAVERVMADGSWQGRARKRRKDGREVVVDAIWTLVRDAEGEPSAVLVIGKDVTDRLELEAQLRQVQRLEAVGQLTGGVAHDFNNLLTVILGSTDTLVDDLGDDLRLRRLAELARAAAQRGADLTHRLLAFSRRQPLEPRLIKVNALVAGMDGLVRRTLPATIAVEFVRAGGLWDVRADPAQLESAVLNLCINARDAMPTGGRLTIETGNAHLDADYAGQHAEVSAGQYVMVAVTDTGEGMSAETLAQAFDPFFTTKEPGKGTGLGLSMVYGFVKQSHGHVKIYSEPGVGTTVKIYLPRAVGTVELDAGRPPDDVVGGTETVLLVEDDPLVRGLALEQLTTLGYAVIEAGSAAEALAQLETAGTVHVLFTDLVLSGGMNGLELAEAAVARYPDLRVVHTSGYTENAIVHQGRLESGGAVLSKPYRRDQLARTLRQVLDGPPR